METKRYILEVSTNWCGEHNEYAVISNSDTNEDLLGLAQMMAYDNFSNFGGWESVLEELFPEVEEGEYTKEQEDEASEVEGEYYEWSISGFEGNDEEFGWYELVYDIADK